MATPENEFEVSLSKELSSNKKENGSVSCDEKTFVLGDNVTTKSSSNKANLDKLDDANVLLKNAEVEPEFLECTDENMFNQNCEGTKNSSVGNTVSDTKKNLSSSTGSVKGNNCDEIGKNKRQIPMSRERKVNETLLEEDEMGSSGNEEEHYESAEEEHITPEEAEVSENLS